MKPQRNVRKFLKCRAVKCDGFYPEQSLSDRFNMRRTQAGFIFQHKLIHGNINCMDFLCELSFCLPCLNR